MTLPEQQRPLIIQPDRWDSSRTIKKPEISRSRKLWHKTRPIIIATGVVVGAIGALEAMGYFIPIE